MVPGAEFDVAQPERRNRLLVERISKFGNWHETALADQEVGAARVADLRVSRSSGRRTAVEDRSGQGQIARRGNPESSAWNRKWIAGPAARQVVREGIRTTERRVDEGCRVLTNVKLVVEGDLPGAKRGLTVEELLLQPQIVETRRRQSFDGADRQQIADRVPRQAAPADLVPVNVKARSRPIRDFFEVEMERNPEQALVNRQLPYATGGIGQRFRDIVGL